MIIRGYALPRGLEPPGLTTLSFGDVQVEVPVLTPAFLSELLDRLEMARDHTLASRPVAEILKSIDRTIARWQDPAEPCRRLAEAALPAVTGFSPPMVAHALTVMLAPYRRAALWAVLDDELGDARVLDAFRPDRSHRGSASGGRLSRASGPRLTAHIFSGNIPALPAHSLIYALLVKSASLGKSASTEPVFPALFVQTLAETDPDLADCLAIVWWKGGEQALEQIACGRADAVVAYGDDASLASLRALTPATTAFIGYGHKVSLALISLQDAGQDVDALAVRLANDVACFDQQGCLSPHAVYVEETGAATAEEFAARLAEALTKVETHLPSGRRGAGVASAVRQVRGAAEFEAIEALADDGPGSGRSGTLGRRVFQSPHGLHWTVLYEADPAFVPSPLGRTVRVKLVKQLANAIEHLRPWRSALQAVGIAVKAERLGPLAEALAALGVARICPLGQMQSPRLAWHGEVGLRLLDLVRWTDLET